MPEISRFLGIVIRMYYRDHAPPHFHATYGDYDITVEIETGVTEGRFPRRALAAVLEWYEQHQAELRAGSGRGARSRSRGLSHWSNGMIRVTVAEYLGGLRVRLTFSDGASGVVDFRDRLNGPIFRPLNDPEIFGRFN